MRRSTRRVLYQRQLVLFLGFSFVLVMLLSALVMTAFRSSSERRIRDTIGGSLDQVEYQSRFISERAVYVALAFYDSEDTATYLFRPDASPLTAISAQNDMRERVAAHPFLAYGALYHRGAGLLGTSARGESEESPQRLLETLDGAPASPRKVVIRVLEQSARGTNQEAVISYVYSEGIVGGRYETAAVVDVPFRAQLEHVMSGQAGPYRASMLIAPDSSVVYPDEYRELAAAMEAIVGAERRGIVEVDVDGGTSLAGFTTDRTTGLTTVVLYDLLELRQASLTLQRRIALLSIVVLAAGWTLALVLTRYSYLPIQNLLDRVDPEHFYDNVRKRLDEMEYLSRHFSDITEQVSALRNESVERSMIFRELVLRSLLLGEPLPAGYEQSLDTAQRYYALLLATRSDAVSYEHEHVRTTAESQFGERCVVIFVDTQTTVLLVPEVGSSETDAMKKNTRTLLESLNADGVASCNVFSLRRAVAVEELNSVYRELRRLRNYQLFYDSPRLVTPEVVEEEHPRIAPYRQETEKELLEAMRFAHVTRHRTLIAGLCRSFYDCTYQSVISVFLQLALAHGRAIDETSSTSSAFTNAVSLSRQAELWESFDDTRSMFERLFAEFQDARARASGAVRTEARRKIEEAAAFIREQIDNPELTVGSVAANAAMSRSHFSRQFKEHVGVSVNEFIARERMELAQRLLTETSNTVESVARQCGIHNTKYFFKLFKAHIGLTPAAYRASQTSHLSE